jgi:nucleotide-binding universal stress UspA family protein
MAIKILCAIDDQEHSERAAMAAIDLAKRLSAELLFYMVNPSVLPGRGPVVHLWSDDYIESCLDEAVRRARRAGIFDVSTGTRRATNIADAIVAHADEHDIDYIVVGAGDRSRLMKAIGGSVSRDVAAKANCPVLVVRRVRIARQGEPSCELAEYASGGDRVRDDGDRLGLRASAASASP